MLTPTVTTHSWTSTCSTTTQVYLFEEGDWYWAITREGCITKRLGHRHYQTWMPLRVVDADCPLQSNRFWRFYRAGPARVCPRSGRCGLKLPGKKYAGMIYKLRIPATGDREWRNILIDPAQAEDLMGNGERDELIKIVRPGEDWPSGAEKPIVPPLMGTNTAE